MPEVTISLLEEDGCEEDEDEVDEDDEVVVDKIYPYEMMRNERVAEIRAEFERRNPTFEKDVRELKDKMAVKTSLPRKKKELDPTPKRKSSRIQGKVDQTPDLVDELEVGHLGDYLVEDNGMVELELESDHVILPGKSIVMENGDVEPGLEKTEEAASHPDDVMYLTAGDNLEHPGRFTCLPCNMAFR